MLQAFRNTTIIAIETILFNNKNYWSKKRQRNASVRIEHSSIPGVTMGALFGVCVAPNVFA